MTIETFMLIVVSLMACIAALLWFITIKLDEIRDAAQRVGNIMEQHIREQDRSGDPESWG